jgi:hypothetical protein
MDDSKIHSTKHVKALGFLTPKPLCLQKFRHMLLFVVFFTSYRENIYARLFKENNSSPKVLK